MFWPYLAALATGVADAPSDAGQLTGLSIEELSNVEVTSAGRRPEPLSQAPASLFLITNEDILRWGGTTLPEVLRLAPNLDVQRIDARQYAITARGFQGAETANKLLVQIDGRSIYSTLFSGVFWELWETPLEDVDRIEVISGPGGTLYGTNAVNGVINITSKDARDTPGLLARGTAGAREQTGLLRYGAPIGGDGAVRVYAMGYNRDGFPASGQRALQDGGEGLQTGFRADFGLGNDQLTLQGDLFDHESDGLLDGGEKGWNILGRWTGEATDGSSTQAQAYYSRFSRRFQGVFDRLAMADVSLQHNRTEGRHALVFGGGARVSRDKFINPLNAFQLVPQSKTLWIVNAFAQDRIDLGDRVALTAGLKLEKTTFTGLAIMPSLRLAWQPADDHLLYASAARSVREPSRIDRDLQAVGILEAGTFQSEKLTAVELGYRGQPARNASVHVSVYYHLYDDLRSTQTTPVTIIPVRLANGIRGDTWGVEAWGQVQATPWWRLSAGFTTLEKNFRLKPGETDLENFISLGNDPGFIGQLGSRIDLGPDIGLDAQLRHYASRPNPAVPAYTDLDARIGWRVSPPLELYLSGTNLFHDRRKESEDTDRGQLVQRIVTLGARFRL